VGRVREVIGGTVAHVHKKQVAILEMPHSILIAAPLYDPLPTAGSIEGKTRGKITYEQKKN
jgi:hypothetical protein